MCSQAITKRKARGAGCYSRYSTFPVACISCLRVMSPSRHVFSAYRPLVVWIFRIWNWCDGCASAFEVAEFPFSSPDLFSHWDLAWFQQFVTLFNIDLQKEYDERIICIISSIYRDVNAIATYLIFSFLFFLFWSSLRTISQRYGKSNGIMHLT